MLDINELSEIDEIVCNVIENQSEEILSKLNRTGQLQEFLNLLGLGYLINPATFYSNRDGKILVIGQADVPKEKLVSAAKKMGINKNRFEFYLEYNDAKTFNFKKAQYSTNYCAILAGPMPHSGTSKDDYSSILTAIENEPGFPPVVRMGKNGLNFSLSSFKDALQRGVQESIISVENELA